MTNLERDLATLDRVVTAIPDPHLELRGMMWLYEKYAAPRIKSVSDQIAYTAITGKDGSHG